MNFVPSVNATAVDLSARTKLRLVGADRVRFLNGQVSNDVRQASAAQSIYTCVMTIKGKMCADAFIHSTGDALLVDAEPGVRESLAARLEKYIIADDVTLEDVTDDIGLLHIFLPLDSDPAAGEPFIAAAMAAGLRSIRSRRYGQPGLDLFGSTGAIEDARAELRAGLPFLDAEALETHRILAGVPKWGAELDENTMPAEAGLEERAVSYTKGCYIGQEVVSRLKSVGHVNRHLRGLRSTGTDELAAGLSLYPSDDPTGREVGRVTSVTRDPVNERASIALAFVRRGWETPGTILAAPEDRRLIVCELPFT